MKKVRYITDAAMVTAIMGVLLLISNLTGGTIVSGLTFILPVPITIYGLKYDWKKAIIPAVATVLIGILINMLVGLLYVLPSVLVAVIYSFVLKWQTPKLSLKIGVMFLGSLLVNVLTTIIFSKALFGYTIIEDTTALANEMVTMLSKIIAISDWMSKALTMLLVSVIPATIVVTSIIEAILTYFVISLVSEKLLKIQLGAFVLSLNIAVPKLVTYIVFPLSLISLFFINSIVEYETFGFTQVIVTIGLNIFVILVLAYLIEALVLCSLYFSKINKRYLLILPLIGMFIFPIALVVLGFLDSIFNYRYRLLK